MKLQQDTLLYLRASRCTTDTRTWERLDFGPTPQHSTPRLISCANFGPLDVGRVKTLHCLACRILASISVSLGRHLPSFGQHRWRGQGTEDMGYWHCFYGLIGVVKLRYVRIILRCSIKVLQSPARASFSVLCF